MECSMAPASNTAPGQGHNKRPWGVATPGCTECPPAHPLSSWEGKPREGWAARGRPSALSGERTPLRAPSYSHTEQGFPAQATMKLFIWAACVVT